MKENNKFSIKKLLKTISIWIVISVFVGATYNFFATAGSAVMFQAITETSEYPEEMVSYFESVNDAFGQSVETTKEILGENFPAEGANFVMYAVGWPAYQIARIYTFSVIAGIIIGSLVYILMVQKATNKKAILEVVIAFILIAALVGVGYLANNLVLKAVLGNDVVIDDSLTFSEYSITNWIWLYVILAVVLYVVNIVKQKIITNKLNKELNK